MRPLITRFVTSALIGLPLRSRLSLSPCLLSASSCLRIQAILNTRKKHPIIMRNSSKESMNQPSIVAPLLGTRPIKNMDYRFVIIRRQGCVYLKSCIDTILLCCIYAIHHFYFICQVLPLHPIPRPYPDSSPS